MKQQQQQQTGDVYGFNLYVNVGGKWRLERLAGAVGEIAEEDGEVVGVGFVFGG